MNNLNLDEKYITFIKSTVQTVFDDTEIYIFGSRTQNQSYKYSDVDIALKGKQKLDITKILALKAKFHDSAFPYKVDIVDFNTLDKNFLSLIKPDMIKI